MAANAWIQRHQVPALPLLTYKMIRLSWICAPPLIALGANKPFLSTLFSIIAIAYHQI